MSIERYIKTKIEELAKSHDVRILFAVESGSRAWGFPSKDSDYDVRFVYARKQDDYLSIRKYRDVIETDIVDDRYLGVPLDMNGWDVRKALQLAVKSNAVLIEWLTSPIRYMVDDKATNAILQLAQDIADIGLFKKHYNKMTSSAWKQIEESGEQVKLKLYCYAFRPALALIWLDHFNTTPPMDISSLLKELKLNSHMVDEIRKFIDLKATADESDVIERNTLIDELIGTALAIDIEDPIVNEETKIIEADGVFREIIK